MAFQSLYHDQHHMFGGNEGAFFPPPIGQPVTFSSGQFAGKTIRFDLKELQKADSGRKYAKVDRRPLDPPPAILLRLFYVRGYGTDREWETEVQNYEDVRNLGILCTVDLFPVPDTILDNQIPVPPTTVSSNIPDFSGSTSSSSHSSSSSTSSPSSGSASSQNPNPHLHPHLTGRHVPSSSRNQSFELTSFGALKLNYGPSTLPNGDTDGYTYFPLHPFTTPQTGTDANGTTTTGIPRVLPFQIPRRQPMLGQINESRPPTDIVLRIGNHMVTESSKLTPALVGEKFVEPALIDYKGQKCLMFVFGDLAVQREGTFIFRYRAFDIFSFMNGSQDHPVVAELYGGPFRVYSTREFPGLDPSTELTRNLSKFGVRVTLRDAERKSKKRSDSERDG